ncbi:uncharacterized protein LOC135823090 isoform X1 [Sycon ciliatum]|uniref:uncharacterized protein LOC135823090 isoform X1 n=1 Tax=Sycon ciliatum TaxID=27933 RepID=UPI0031F6856A
MSLPISFIPLFARIVRCLYGKPRMSIHIRGKKVQTRYLERMLDRVEYDSYRPMTVMRQDMVRIVFGLAESKDSPYGMMLYHNNRLIKGYYHMGLQARAEAVGVVGVIDCPFLQPTHNKQEFDGSQQYQAFLKSLQAKLKDYWYRLTHREVKDSITGKVVREENVAVTFRKQSASDVRSAATDLWVQCDQCKKWRKLSKQLDTDTADGEWYCFMNEDPLHSDCNHPEENEDSCDADAPRKKITRAPKRPSMASERERDRKEQEAKMQRDKQALEEREERLRQKEKMMARQQRAEKRASEAANHEAVSPVEEHATAHASPEMAAGLASPAASPDNRDFAIAPPPDPASLHGLFTDSEDTPAADGFIRESIVKMEPVDGQPAMNKCAVQCCKCSKWRQVPVSAFYNLSDAMLWECSMNPDPRMCDSCQFPQAIRSSAVACLDARCKKPYRPQAASARTRAASSVSDTDAESLASRELATSPEVANMMPTATTGQMDMPSASTLTTATTRPGPNNHTTATGNSLQQADNSDNTTGSDNDEDYTFPSSGIFSPTPAVNTYSDGNTMAEGLDRASETDSAPSPPLLQGADEDEYDGAFTAAEVVSASNAPAPTPTAAEQGRRARTVTARAVSGPAAESIRRDAQSRHWVTSSRKRPSTVQAYGSDSTGAEESADSRQPPAKQAWTRLTPGRATAGEQPDQLPATEGTSNQQRDSDQMDAEEDYAGERERDLESKLRESEECCNQLTQEMGKQQQQHDDQCKRLQDQVAHLEAKLRERTEELEDARRKIEQQEAELSKAKTKTRQLSRSTTIKREPTAVILLG